MEETLEGGRGPPRAVEPLERERKNTIIDKVLTYASETGTLTKRDRKPLNVFERKVCRKF